AYRPAIVSRIVSSHEVHLQAYPQLPIPLNLIADCMTANRAPAQTCMTARSPDTQTVTRHAPLTGEPCQALPQQPILISNRNRVHLIEGPADDRLEDRSAHLCLGGQETVGLGDDLQRLDLVAEVHPHPDDITLTVRHLNDELLPGRRGDLGQLGEAFIG